jgi:SAM-dependent methyltransferase
MQSDTAQQMMPSIKNWWTTAFESPICQALLPVERGPQVLDAELKLLPDWLAIKPGDTVLDLACGEARLAAPLAAAGYKVTGIDSSAKIIAQARRRVPETQGRLTLIQGDMRSFQLPKPADAAYCVFLSWGMFTEEEDHLKTLQTIASSLKPGGRLFIEAVNVAPNSWPNTKTIRLDGGVAVYQEVLDFRKGRHNVIVHVAQTGKPTQTLAMSWRVFMLWEMVNLMEAAGFNVLQVNGGVKKPVEFLPVEHRELGVLAEYRPDLLQARQTARQQPTPPPAPPKAAP